MSIGIILASHGEFAKAALGSAEMLAGEQKDVHALALTVEKSLDDLEKEVADAYADLPRVAMSSLRSVTFTGDHHSTQSPAVC